MKAQTRMIVASAVVIALALTAVSGITYSWFSDTEETKINVSTAKIDYEVTYTAEANSSVGTTATVSTDGTIEITNLLANAAVTINADIVNKSTIKTVYKVVATPTYDDKSSFTLYDFVNIAINSKQLTADDKGNEMVLRDWTVTEKGAAPEDLSITITTPADYGSVTADGTLKEIVAYNTKTGAGLTETGGENTAVWNMGNSGLTIKLSIVAIQGDYPYTLMDVDESTKVASAALPANKVVKATEIKSSAATAGADEVVRDVVVDFSNVTSYGTTKGTTTGTDVTNQEVKLEVKSVESTSAGDDGGKVELSLNLGTESTATPKYFDKPVVITMTVPGKFTNPVIVYNAGEGKKGENGTVISSVISGNSTTITFSVTHFSDYTIQNVTGVSTAENLKAVLEKGVYAKLTADITDISQSITLPADSNKVELDLNGHNIKFTNNAGFINIDKLEIVGKTAGSVINVLPNNHTFADGKPVFDGITGYATLSEALSANTSKANLTLYCKPNATINETSTAGIADLSYSLTIYGNGAIINNNDGTFTFADSVAAGSEIALKVYSLSGFTVNDGNRTSDYKMTLVIKNCTPRCVRIDGMTGSVDVTIDGCTFPGTYRHLNGMDSDITAIKFDPNGTVRITDTTFKNYVVPINMKNDGTGGTGEHIQDITIIGCTFTDCGTKYTVEYAGQRDDSAKSANYGTFATAIRVVAENSDAVTNLTTSNNKFIYSEDKEALIADMILGDPRSVLGTATKINNGTINWNNDGIVTIVGTESVLQDTNHAKAGKVTTLNASGAIVKVVLADSDEGKINVISNGEITTFVKGVSYAKDNVTYIRTVSELETFRNAVNNGTTYAGKTVVLCNDLNLNGAEWTPIRGNATDSVDGYHYTGFSGIFDGRGYTVSNFKVSNGGTTTNKECVGLFGQLNGGSVLNLNVDKAAISSNHWAGGIAGHANNALIYNCSVTNSKITAEVENTAKEGETASYDNGDKVGGIAGWCIGTVENCAVSNTTLTAYRDVGGIVGSSGEKKVDEKIISTLTVKKCVVDESVKIVQNLEHDSRSIDANGKVGGNGYETYGNYCSSRAGWTPIDNTGKVDFSQTNRNQSS